MGPYETLELLLAGDFSIIIREPLAEQALTPKEDPTGIEQRST